MVGKIQFSVSDISIERLKKEDREDLLNFSCGVDKKENKLNGFFHSDDLFLCDKHHFCSVYIVRQKSTSSLLAVFTLANDSIGLLSQDDKKSCKKMFFMTLLKIIVKYGINKPPFQQLTSVI